MLKPFSFFCVGIVTDLSLPLIHAQQEVSSSAHPLPMDGSLDSRIGAGNYRTSSQSNSVFVDFPIYN
jgi:hypothetical protein